MINALALGPMQTYDENALGNWKKKSIFDTLYDKEFSLFEQRDHFVFYLGTYKAICLLEHLKNGVSITQTDNNVSNETQNQKSRLPVNPRTLAALVQSTIPNFHGPHTQATRKNDQFSPNRIGALYLDGRLKVEALGLQYVGFDGVLYANMLKRFQGPQSAVVMPEAATLTLAQNTAPPSGPPPVGNGNGKRKAGQVIQRRDAATDDDPPSRGGDSKRQRLSEGGWVSTGRGNPGNRIHSEAQGSSGSFPPAHADRCQHPSNRKYWNRSR